MTMMDTVTVYDKNGKPTLYPRLTPVDSSRQIDAYLRMTALGRHVLQVRADAAGRRVAPVIPHGMSVATRNELLGASSAGRSLLARERQP